MSQQNHPASFTSFDAFKQAGESPLHAQWRQDRTVRHRVPLTEAWRGCVGLAALFRNAEHALNHGDLMLMPNSHMQWLVLRDVPIGHFPGSQPMNRRDVNLASLAQAEFRYGMPVIDFTRDPRNSWDFKFEPSTGLVPPSPAELDTLAKLGFKPEEMTKLLSAELPVPGDTLHAVKDAREFGVLNKLSAEMTRFAFAAKDHQGRPVRPSWHKAKPEGVGTVEVEPPYKWFPSSYLGFPIAKADQIYWEATESKPEGHAIMCSKCKEHVDAKVFRFRAKSLHVQTFESGDFVADCPACRQRHKWHLEDMVPAKIVRHFPIAFKDRFTRDLGEGLPLRSVGKSVYCGPLQYARERDNANLPDAVTRCAADLVPHRFRSEVTGDKYLVYLPAFSRIVAKQGQVLDAGEVWAYGLHENPSPSWSSQDRLAKWQQLEGVCGGHDYVGLFQQAWFEHQAVVDADAPGQILWPSDLVGLAAKGIEPTGIWWDICPAGRFTDSDLDAIVFPPLRVHEWDKLRFSLPGDVALDAGINDDRFDRRVGRGELKKHKARRATVKA